MTHSPHFVECTDVCYSYQRGNEQVPVLNHLNLSIQQGEFVALMGPSGSGKTTFLNLLGGLDQATSGNIAIQGVQIESLSANTMADWRAVNVGFVFQFYNLLPMLSALDNVALPLALTNLTAKQRRSRAAVALQIVGLAERIKHKPSELSGGQQQRVAIARALAADPDLLICDEPTGDLDRSSADEVLSLLTTLNREQGKTIIMVTHDPKAAAYANRVLSMDKGELQSPAGVTA